MAWNISKAKRQALVKLQLRDKNGRWIEMGGGVKWYSSKRKKVIAGTVVGSQGNYALVRLNKENPTHEPALVKVKARSIQVVNSKGKISLPGKNAPADQTPEFEAPEAVGRVPQRDNGSATKLPNRSDNPDDYAISDTSDGNTYISRKDGEELYFPARGLRAGDELIAPAGADPTKPFSIGRGWATKKAERLNTGGPLIGKVLSVDGDRYAVVQLPDGHTITGRDGQETDLVTVGLTNRVIKATPGLKNALGDKLKDSTFAENSDAEEEEIDEADEEASRSDHVGREVPEDLQGEYEDNGFGEDADTIASYKLRGKVFDDLEAAVRRAETDPGIRMNGPVAEVYDDQAARATLEDVREAAGDNASMDRTFTKMLADIDERESGQPKEEAQEAEPAPEEAAPEEAPAAEKKKKTIFKHRITGKAKDELQFGIETQETDGRDPGVKLVGNNAEVTDIDNAIWTVDGPLRILNDNIEFGDVTGKERADAKAKQRGLQRFRDALVAKKGGESKPEEAPENDQESSEAPEAQPTEETPVEDAPEAPEEAPEAPEETPEPEASPEAPRIGGKATSPEGVLEGLARIEQDMEDIDANNLVGEDLAAALEEAKFDFIGADGVGYTISADRNDGDWWYDLHDMEGFHKGSWDSGAYNSIADIAPDIHKTANGGTSKTNTEESTPVEEAPEAPAAVEYDENGLTPEEAKEAAAALRMATKAYDRNDFERGDRYSNLADEIMKRGEERKAANPAPESEEEAPTPSPEPETAPESAPEPEEAPEVTPEPEAPVEEAPAPTPAPVEEAPEAPEVEEAPVEAPAPAESDDIAAAEERDRQEAEREQQYVDEDGEPEEQEEVEPVSDEEAGRVLKTLTSDNPLPEGVERHVPEAIEGESFPPTQQQQDVIDAVLGGLNTLVQAKAGAGKTSTLRAIARRLKLSRPNDKVGYIAFNKTVQLEANATMPNNVEARTGHSVAHKWSPDWMKDRADASNAIRRPGEVARHLGIFEPISVNGKAFSPTDQAMAVTRTIDTFANSAEDAPSRDHLPDSVKAMPEAVQDAIVGKAVQAWDDLSNQNGRLRMTLDHMRKHWALSRPDFSKSGSGLNRPVKVLFLDEAQDTPPVLAKVIADQKNVQKVIVGDADQAIYGFTGATDYLSSAQGDVELPLNKSWRFGPEVADMGNRFLQLLKSPGRVVGGGARSKIVEGMQDADAVLVRSNGGMLGEIAKELEAGRTVGVPKGTKKDLESLVESAHYLRGSGGAPTKMHDDLAAFRTWAEFLEEEQKGDDPTLSKIKRMVDTYGLQGMEELISRVVETGEVGLDGVTFENHPAGLIAGGNTWAVASMTPRGTRTYFSQAGFRWTEHPDGLKIESGQNEGQPLKVWIANGNEAQRERKLAKLRELAAAPDPDVVISTAHKSKGLEWGRVRIGDDFRGPKVDEDGKVTEMPKPEELRLAYVAVTRAEKELDAGSLGWVRDFTSENGGDPDTGGSDADDAPESPETPDATEAKESTKEDSSEEETPADEAPEVPEEVEETSEEEKFYPPVEEVNGGEFNEDGLTPEEEALFNALNERLARSWSPDSDENPEFLGREIDRLLEHGDQRKAGQDVPTFVPTPEPTSEPLEAKELEPEEPTTKEKVPVATGRRPRETYNGDIVVDSNGQAINAGDTVGHRTHGPVQVTGIVSGAGRIKFLNPRTGRESSVAAHLVTRIDPNAAPDVDSSVDETLPTEPGTIIVDPLTGKKGFIDANGQKVLSGDTVTTRDGQTARVHATYPGADGKASVALDFGDGRRPHPRKRGNTLTKVDPAASKLIEPDNTEETPAPTPEAPKAVEVTPEATPEPAPVAAPEPEVEPEAPETPTLRNELGELWGQYSRGGRMVEPLEAARRNQFERAPLGAVIRDSYGNTAFVKTAENEWERDGFKWSTGEMVQWTRDGGPNEADWRFFESQDDVRNSITSAPVIPSEPVVDDMTGEVEEESPVDARIRRKIMVEDTMTGDVIRSTNGEHTFTRNGPNDWASSVDNGWYSDDDIVNLIGVGEARGLTYVSGPEPTTPSTPTTTEPVRLNGFDNPVEGELVPQDEAEALQTLGLAPVGTKVSSSSGVSWTKTGLNEWKSDQYGTYHNNVRMAQLATFDETEVRMTYPEPGAANAYDVFSDPDEGERRNAFESAGIGDTITNDGWSFTKIGANDWRNQYGSVYTNGEMVQGTGPNGTFGANWQHVAAPQLDLTSINADPALRMDQLEAMPVGTLLRSETGVEVRKLGNGKWQIGESDHDWENDTISTLTGTMPSMWTVDLPATETPAAPAAPVQAAKPEAPKFHSGIAVGSFMPSAKGSKSGLKKIGDNQWEMLGEDGSKTGRIVDDNAANVLFDLTKPEIVPPPRDYGLSNFDGEGRSWHHFMMDNSEAYEGAWAYGYRQTKPLSPEQQSMIRNAYTNFVDEVNKKLPNGFTAKLTSPPSFDDGGKFSTTIKFYSRTGQYAGYATREFGIEDIFGIKRTKVYHSWFEVKKQFQGSGINNAFLEESLKLYEQFGLDAVRVTANIDVGGYTWARSGFNFLTVETMTNTIRSIRRRLQNQGAGLDPDDRRKLNFMTDADWDAVMAKLDEYEAKATEENFVAGRAPSAISLSRLGWNSTMPSGRDSLWAGKVAMLGLNWSGVRGIDAERNLREA